MLEGCPPGERKETLGWPVELVLHVFLFCLVQPFEIVYEKKPVFTNAESVEIRKLDDKSQYSTS